MLVVNQIDQDVFKHCYYCYFFFATASIKDEESLRTDLSLVIKNFTLQLLRTKKEEASRQNMHSECHDHWKWTIKHAQS